MNKKLLHYVTGNAYKFNEAKRFISAHDSLIELVQVDLDVPELQTDDQRAIARDKAMKAWELIGKPLLIDDAAIYFERYHKFPGTLTKYVWSGIGFEGINRLITDGDAAYFLLTMVYVDEHGELHFFEGRLDGLLTKIKMFTGNDKMPFDEFFIPEGQIKHYDEVKKDFALFEQYSYRIRALKAFLAWFK